MSTKIPLYQDIESTNVPNVATWLGFYKNESHLVHYLLETLWKTRTSKIAQPRKSYGM